MSFSAVRFGEESRRRLRLERIEAREDWSWCISPPYYDWENVIDAEFVPEAWCVWEQTSHGRVPSWVKRSAHGDYWRERVCWALSGEELCPVFGVPATWCGWIHVVGALIAAGWIAAPEDIVCEHRMY